MEHKYGFTPTALRAAGVIFAIAAFFSVGTSNPRFALIAAREAAKQSGLPPPAYMPTPESFHYAEYAIAAVFCFAAAAIIRRLVEIRDRLQPPGANGSGS
ncbi:MAG: hypothetical protein SFV21_00265 [Rhodospirillaceae bacterium]|nr:hypothetical protein [Rhodospirillaceae bacterium]